MASSDMWRYGGGTGTWSGTELVGYDVEATDGGIGSVDEASDEVDSSYIVVDTGPWIFGKKVMLPAGVIRSVDSDERKIFVDRTKDEIKDAPEFDEDRYRSQEYRSDVGGYYERGRSTRRPEDEGVL